MIESILKKYYNLEVFNIEKLIGGESALAYKVTARDGVYFLKVFPNKTDISFLENLSIRNQILSSIFEKHPALPIKNTNNISITKHHEHYVLYNFINGITPAFEYSLNKKEANELLEILLKLHEAKLPNPPKELIEDFAVPYLKELNQYLFTNTINLNKEQLNTIELLIQKIDGIKIKPQNFVFCHTDIHNGNIIIGDKLYLIDWDNLKFAPKEHDLQFLFGATYQESFIKNYEKRSNTKLDINLLKFYLIRRKIEDIWEYIDLLIKEDFSLITKDYIIKNLFDELEKSKIILFF